MGVAIAETASNVIAMKCSRYIVPNARLEKQATNNRRMEGKVQDSSPIDSMVLPLCFRTAQRQD